MYPKFITFLLAFSLLLFTACGDQSPEATATATPEKPLIPDAPDAAVKTILTEFSAGNAGILWDAMPKSYQGDIDSLAQLLGNKSDPELYNKTFALLSQLASTVDKQKVFIVEAVKANRPDSAEQVAQLQTALPEIVTILQTLTTSNIASIEGLKSFSGEKFFDTTVASMVGQMKTLSTLSGEEFSLDDLAKVQVTQVKEADGIVTLTMVAPDEAPETAEFTQVDGRWVPVEMANQWVENVANMKAQLEAITPEAQAAQKPQIMGALTMVEGVLTQISAAETQAQFDQTLKGAMMPLFGMIMMFQQNMAPPPAAPSAPITPSAP